ncbi:hypothetical protein FB45DRAFT_1029564 [Roridomyces roridus]|uniref:BTB domain-containing protein n=1 Tax=Roridomyces roridus TaxID=1738132 RepID=A0AAD7BQB1_9AGAR|nr:hypothetical protein FB45DRAFT_1029564 [Roridomyces roridus]
MQDLPPKAPPSREGGSTDVITRSSIWYFDGSVVLQAETTQFRVHRSILAASSAIFKDMLGVHHAPSEKETTVDGEPLVQMHDDKAKDVELVLLALYDRKFFQKPQKTFDQVAAMWRLGKKYEFEELRDEALERLEACYPSTLDKFKINVDQARTQTQPIAHYPGMHIDAIKFARETGLVAILPAAYYACNNKKSQRDILEEIMDGVLMEGGSRAHLSDNDKRVCILATSTLMQRQWQAYRAYKTDTTHRSCSTGLQTALARETLENTLCVDPLGPISLRNTSVNVYNACQACHTGASSLLNEEQAKIWNDLPGIYGLPSRKRENHSAALQ